MSCRQTLDLPREGNTALASALEPSEISASLARNPLPPRSKLSPCRRHAPWMRDHLQTCSGEPLELYVTPASGGAKAPHKFLSDVFDQRVAWKKQRDEREPHTFEMFEALSRHVIHLASVDGTAHLNAECAVLDWATNGLHTGSRLAEHGQSKLKKGELFAHVPNSKDAGEWAGRPVTFIREGLATRDKGHIEHSHQECLRNPSLAHFLEVRFRFDKSKKNLVKRKYKRVSGNPPCVVKSASSVLL